MAFKGQTSNATIFVADGAGGMRQVVDHRFDEQEWLIREAVAAAQAETWMAHLSAESQERGWSTSSIGQIAAEFSSGAMTIHLLNSQAGPAIQIAWEKARNGDLVIGAKAGGTPSAEVALVRQFFQSVAYRVQAGRLDRTHRRFWLMYNGLPWRGELWLTDSIRLGPPSKRPDALLGHQAVIVDAVVEGIGFAGVTASFHRLLRELRLVLSPMLGVHLQSTPQWTSDWVPEIDDVGKILDCRLRSIGYTEIGLPADMPVQGVTERTELEPVSRPGLGRRGIWPGDNAQRVPADVHDLWKSFQNLPLKRKDQFLNACNAYGIAQDMWPHQRTAYAAFLVIACEALKPASEHYDRANVYDVAASLIDQATAAELRALPLPPQKLRSKHVHRGTLAADDMAPLLFSDPFRDPSFDETLTRLSQVARTCLIEWLRSGGNYKLVWMPRVNNFNLWQRLTVCARTFFRA